jgi:membrane associated rhomboid family serine protease
MTSTGAPFSNAARNLRQLRHSPASWACAVVILGIQAVITAIGGQDSRPAWTWFETFGLSRDGVMEGKLWQILTYGLLHGGWWHAGLNAVFILLVGSRIEHMAGRGAMVKVTILGIIGGGIGHLMVAPGGVGAAYLVGLSGGCVALLLLLTTLSPESRMMPIPISGRSLGLGILIAELILALVDPASRLPGFSKVGEWLVDLGLASWFQMGHACHFGGGMAGWMMGKWLLRPRTTLKRLRRERERREASEFRRMG